MKNESPNINQIIKGIAKSNGGFWINGIIYKAYSWVLQMCLS